MNLDIKDGYLVWKKVNQKLAVTACPAFECVGEGGRVPFSYENTHQLANYGVPVITPMCLEYDYPICAPHKPYLHQYQGADFLAANKYAYLFMGAGTGKTLTAGWAFDYLLRKGIIERVLVVTTLSTIYSAWADDLTRNLPHLSYRVIVSQSPKKRKRLFRSKAAVHIIHHDGAALFWKDLAANNYDLIVVDECTAIKNPKTNRFKGVQALKFSCNSPRIWEMTATPCAQSPEDAYGQIVLISNVNENGERCPPAKILGSAFMSAKAWRDLTTTSSGDGIMTRRIPKPEANDIIFKYMRPAFSRRTRDCVDLPPEIILPTPDCKATHDMAEAWKKLRSDGCYERDGKRAQAVNAPGTISKVLQVASGFVYGDVEDGYDDDISRRGERPVIVLGAPEKNAKLLEYIQTAEGKTIVYVPFTAAVELVDEFLKSHGVRTVKIYGSLSPKEVRHRINVQFQSDSPDSPQVIVAQPEKMSHGITATAASMTVWYGPITRGEVYQQANMRMARIGQKKTQYIVHLSSCGTEKRRYQQLRLNHNRQQDFMELYEDFKRGAI